MPKIELQNKLSPSIIAIHNMKTEVPAAKFWWRFRLSILEVLKYLKKFNNQFNAHY